MPFEVSIWLQFALCAGLIGVAGQRLSLYADVVAEKTGLGRNWTGLILLASVTSLPELVTGVSSVTAARCPTSRSATCWAVASSICCWW